MKGLPTLLALLVILFVAMSGIQSEPSDQKKTEVPVIFNSNETAQSGEVISIQGHAFGTKPELVYAVVSGRERRLKPTDTLPILSRSNELILTILPSDKPLKTGTLWAVWVRNGSLLSKPVFINRARAVTLEYDEIMPGQVFRIFGRNLMFSGRQSTVVFSSGQSRQTVVATVVQADAYTLQVKAPSKLTPGQHYSIQISNGAGGAWGETTVEETLLARKAAPDPFGIAAPWGADFNFYQNRYNVRTDARLSLKALGDSLTNDRVAIQAAIDRAHTDGGGVVYLPTGKYRLEFGSGSGLVMRSKVVLQGDGPTRTVVQYGFGTPPLYPDPIGKGGWPDQTTEGVAILWPTRTELTGLADLQIQNVNTSGRWRHSLKTMPPTEKRPGGSGAKFFAKNCHFQLAVAWGISWGYVDHMVIADCSFDYRAAITWPWLWHCNGSTNFAVRNNRVIYTVGRFGFNDSFNGIIENNHITRLGDLQAPKGETGGFNIDFARDIVVLKNRMDVEGAAIANQNQGETILSQGGNPDQQALGIVTEATATTLKDANQKWPTLRTSSLSSVDAIAIVRGKGTGQWRRIKANTENTITVEKPWEVIPDPGTHYVIMHWSAEDWLVKDNSLDGNNRGIWFYCGANDLAIVGNTLTNSDGIYLRSDQRLYLGRYNLMWNAEVVNNDVVSVDGKRPAYICSTLAIFKGDTIFGTGTIGLNIRQNRVQANSSNVSSFVTGEGYWNEVRTQTPEKLNATDGIIGTVFEKNTAINTDYGYRLSKAVRQTIIKDPVYRQVANQTNESTFPKAEQIGTVKLQRNTLTPLKRAQSRIDKAPIKKNVSHLTDPLDVAKRIGDKLIRDTPFTYRLVRAPVNHTFNDLQFVDFGRTFGVGKSAVAYAYTNLNVANDQELTLQTEHNDGCKIWLNGQLIYEKRGDHAIHLLHEERSVELPNTLKLALRKGNNDLLIKSETQGKAWRVYLQPPSDKGAILTQMSQYPQIGLANVANVDSALNLLTNWLVIGPFENPVTNEQRTGIDTPYAPETARQFGVMYPGLEGPITWTIPKIDILGDLIDPQPWGTNYHWNYHNGGTAWAMQQLSESTNEKKYNDYATHFCDFQLKSIPFVRHQVHTLNAFNSINNHLIDTPLLDFTLAPSLPFIYRLRQTSAFYNREEYVQFIGKMLNYAQKEQIRLPGSGIYTRVTPETYTTWADDMFMGIPFLIQAALYVPDPAMKKAFLDDAANQLIGFNQQVWDSTANLYMHARYSSRAIKLPHWSRANGWAAWAMSEVLMNLPKNHPQYKPILAHYQKHIAALVKLQDASGFWFNVLDRSDSQPEVSGTAIFTMVIARGVKYGWLNAKTYKPIAQKGWEALKTEIEPDGTVHRICMGTMCSEDVNYYINRPFYDNDTHGLFAVLFAGLAMHQMLETVSKL